MQPRLFFPLLCLAASLAIAPCLSAQEEAGEASIYGDDFDGKPTASGEVYDPTQLTAAHRTLRFGTRLQVTNKDNGKTVVVTVNDRGPFITGRIVDLSFSAAEALGMTETGIARVLIHPLRFDEASEIPPPPSVFFQMGAYRTSLNAFAQAKALKAQGFEPRIRQEGTLYRVFLSVPEGPETDDLLAALVKAGLRGYLQSSKEPAGKEISLPTN